MTETLSADEARGLALRAQGFGDRWRGGVAGAVQVLERLRVLQLDSVNVVARPQEVVPFSRVGKYSTKAMAEAVYGQKKGFEYWAHEASWVAMEDYRYFLPRMASYRAQGSIAAFRREHAKDFERVLARLRAEGPLTAAAFDEPEDGAGARARTRAGARGESGGNGQAKPAAATLRTMGTGGNWWERKPAKRVLENLFAGGEVMAAGRTNGFSRLYDLPERVLPAGLDTSDPGAPEATRYLMRQAVRVLGVATGVEVARYYNLSRPMTSFEGANWKTALGELEAAGEVVRVRVEGWTNPGYAPRAALEGPMTVPAHRPVFLSPFDNMIWSRERAERLFGFYYRIEIYVPEEKRQYGYYVLPLLTGGGLTGRADFKLEREEGMLRVRRMYLEGATLEDTASALQDLAAHLGAERVEVEATKPVRARRDLQRLVEQA